MPSSVCDMFRVVAKMEQRIESFVRHNPNITTPAAVTTRWTAAGNELFATKGRHAVTAVASLYMYFCAIDKQNQLSDLKFQISNFMSKI